MKSDQQLRLEWLEQVRTSLSQSGWKEFLNWHGIDLFDAVISVLLRDFVALTPEGTSPPRGRLSTVLERARRTAFRVKSQLVSSWQFRRGTDRAIESCDVLFWPWHINHARPAIFVHRALEKLSVQTAFVTSNPRTYEYLSARDIAVVPSRRFVDTLRPRIREEKRRLLHALQYDPGIVWPLFDATTNNRTALEVIRACLARHTEILVESIALSSTLLDTIRPRLVVAGCDLTIEGRILTQVARQRKIPTAVLAHGSVSGSLVQSRHLADKVYLYGDSGRRYLERIGVSSGRIEVCGAPHLDDVVGGPIARDTTLCEQLDWRSNTPLILWATTGPGLTLTQSHHLTCIENVMRLSSELETATFVAKLHNQDNRRHFRKVAHRVPESRLKVVDRSCTSLPQEIKQWLPSCAAVLVGGSTVGIEAMAYGIPVISMDFADELHDIDFIDAGATTHVRTFDELRRAVRQVISTFPQRPSSSRAVEFLKSAYFALDGNSAHRVATSLCQCINTTSVGISRTERGFVREK